MDPAIYLVGAVGIADLAFTVTDTGWGLSRHLGPRAYGFVETVIAAPQFVIAVQNYREMPAWYTVWMGALTAHGLYTLFMRREDDETKRSVVVTPLGVSGRF